MSTFFFCRYLVERFVGVDEDESHDSSHVFWADRRSSEGASHSGCGPVGKGCESQELTGNYYFGWQDEVDQRRVDAAVLMVTGVDGRPIPMENSGSTAPSLGSDAAAPIAAPVVNVNLAVAPTSPEYTNQWSSGICNCCTLGVCMCCRSCLCPCMVVGEVTVFPSPPLCPTAWAAELPDPTDILGAAGRLPRTCRGWINRR